MKHAPPVEADRRREEFRGDVPIVLADGGTWYFPRPRCRGKYLAVVARDESGEPTRQTAVGITEFGPDYDFRVEEALQNNFNNQLSNAELDWFARFLLRHNYRLDDRDFYFILPFAVEAGDAKNNRMWMDIFCVACDIVMIQGPDDPKALTAGAPNSSNGSGPASSPTGSTPTGSASAVPTASP